MLHQTDFVWTCNCLRQPAPSAPTLPRRANNLTRPDNGPDLGLHNKAQHTGYFLLAALPVQQILILMQQPDTEGTCTLCRAATRMHAPKRMKLAHTKF
jgi:hypothetical protein